MFIETETGYVNLAHVVRVEGPMSYSKRAGERGSTTLHLVDGSVEKTWKAADKISEQSMPIPALPGFFLVHFYAPDDADPATFDIKAALTKETIIAWNIQASWYPIPVVVSCMSGSDDFATYTAVVTPEGHYCDAVGERHPMTEDRWIECAREEWGQKLEAAKQRSDANRKKVAAE